MTSSILSIDSPPSSVPLLVCVDEDDREIGTAEKMEVHRLGLLHRAFSIFVLRKDSHSNWELLLQKRASTKYHTPGLWTNTCCSHAEPGISIDVTVKKRLKEEMGFLCKLNYIGKFIYKADCFNSIIEHEIDHLFVGIIDSVEIDANSTEVDEICWMSISEVIIQYELNPEKFTPWFFEALQQVLDYLIQMK